MTPRAVIAERRGSGMPVVLVHGNGVDHRVLLDVDDALALPGLERIHLDLPGFGDAAPLPAPGGLPELADDLAEAVAELTGAGRFAIVGQSLGGLLARDVAARLRERCAGIALLAPVVDSDRSHRTVPAHEVLDEDAELVAELDASDADEYLPLAVLRTRDNWERFRAAILPGIRAADPGAMAALGDRYTLPELPDDRLAGFDSPVLIVAGRQDAIVGYEDQWRLAQRLPHATYAVLDRAGHNIVVDQPVVVRDLLAGWARDVLASEARRT
ncbi:MULTISPECIES: alpha/beta fold hydrolase [unclassified Salinibacterium]|uniref:alpha/beta fold hydrolase n=1 Tax=unclassified Salinibacterium TaxID=2632331 RepID=UPI0014242711|nr:MULTISPECIES: alpha/beta fold hydrolase [unclassified Salinibacterium]